MSIQPARASFSGTRDETRSFLVQGGAFPYMMSIRGTDSNLISIGQPAVFGPSFTITVKSGAPAGLYAVHVADGSRRTTSLSLEVVGAKASDGGDDGIGTKTPGGEAFDKLELEQRRRIQRALCVAEDGIWGPDTRAALQKHAGSGDSTDENLQAQLELLEAIIDERCSTGGDTSGLEQRLRAALDKASKAVTGQSMDLDDPAGFAVTVMESAVTGDGDDLALSVTISARPPDNGPGAAKASAIRDAILKLIQDPAVTQAHVKIANLDELVRDGSVSNE